MSRSTSKKRQRRSATRNSRSKEPTSSLPKALSHPRWAAALVLIIGIGAGLTGPPVLNELEISGTDTIALGSESAAVATAVEQAAGVSGQSVGVLVPLHADYRERRARRQILKVASIIANRPGVIAVNTYIGTITKTNRFLRRQADGDFVSRDRRWTYLSIVQGQKPQPAVSLGKLKKSLAAFSQVMIGGPSAVVEDLAQIVRHDLRLGEIISIPILLLVLLWFFRGPYLAVLPLFVGLITLLESLVALRLLHQAGLQFSLLATAPVAGLALGLSVDYNLLFVGRYREEYKLKKQVNRATHSTMQAVAPMIGMSVLTIVLILAPLVLFPIRLLISIAMGSVCCVIFAGINTLIILPIAVILFGNRLENTSRREVGSKSSLPKSRSAFWTAIPSIAIKHPKSISLLGASLLLILALPAFGARIGAIDPTNLAAGSEAASVSHVLKRRFKPIVSNEHYVVLVTASSGASRSIGRIERRVRSMKSVSEVQPAIYSQGGYWVIKVIGDADPGSSASQKLVADLRAIPSQDHIYVTSPSAGIVDREASLRSKLPIVLLCSALALYFVLLLLTGSIIIPFKMMLLNAVTLAASLGILTMMFQGVNVGQSSVGSTFDSGQIIALIVVSIALMTDYGVFVIARIIEAHENGREDSDAIAFGLERTGPIVSAAAIVFCVAMGGFLVSDISLIKEMCVGMILAVLIDTSVVRALLVPALMTWLGPYNWWMPRRVATVRRWLIE